MMQQPEFSYPLTLDAARRTRETISVNAGADERAALAKRFDLLSIDRLLADVDLMVEGDSIFVTGHLHADVVQSCVATGEPVPARIAVPVVLKLVPTAQLEAAETEAEIELENDDLDVVDYDGAMIDLGEIVAQSMALALDPWPRHPDADAKLRAAGVKTEGEAGAFGALAALRDQLKS